MRRFWWYPRGEWLPNHWWRYLVPERGGDEYGRRTLVIPFMPFGWLVWAFRTCKCPDCVETRAQTARFEAEQ